MEVKKIFWTMFALMLIVIPASAADETEDETVKIVYQCDFPDVKRVHLMLNTLGNVVKYYQKNMIDFELSIVALGPCLQYVMKDFKDTGFVGKPYLHHGGPSGNGTFGRLDSLKQTAGDSLTVYACGNTMEKKNVKASQLLDMAEITPGGIIKVIELQREGASYIKIK